MPDLRRTALLLGLATVLISLSAVGLRVVPSSRRRQFPSDSLPPSQSELNEEEGGPLPFPTDRRPVRAASLPLPDPSVLFSAHRRPSFSQRGAAAASSSSLPPSSSSRPSRSHVTELLELAGQLQMAEAERQYLKSRDPCTDQAVFLEQRARTGARAGAGAKTRDAVGGKLNVGTDAGVGTQAGARASARAGARAGASASTSARARAGAGARARSGAGAAVQARARATAREPYQPFIYGRILGNVLSSFKNGPYGDKSGSPHPDGGTPGENPGYDEAEWGNPGDPMGPYKYVHTACNARHYI